MPGKNSLKNDNILHGHIPGLSACPRCLHCYPLTKPISNLEKELVDFCKQYYPDLKENDRTLISPKELDIVIPELKLAIEFNGDFWHSIQAGKDTNYHLNKTLECEKAGYRLIHIFEHEWINKQDIIKTKLKALFNVEQEHVYARKCTVKEISSKDKNEFLNLHHIQGEDKSKVKLGLFYQDELVAVMTFGKPRFNKNYEYELIRYATSKHVIGGAGKLLKYFERKYKPKSIITYADRRFSQGNMYFKLGFKLDHIS
jgi:very-short-patch-repair endonuclease